MCKFFLINHIKNSTLKLFAKLIVFHVYRTGEEVELFKMVGRLCMVHELSDDFL